jgi:hypothetical protein
MRSAPTELVALPSYPFFGVGLGLSVFARSNSLRLAGGMLSVASVAWVGFLRWNVSRNIQEYCAMSMKDDLVDIGAHYRMAQSSKGDGDGASHFWVAETEKEDGTKVIVGCVGTGTNFLPLPITNSY